MKYLDLLEMSVKSASTVEFFDEPPMKYMILNGESYRKIPLKSEYYEYLTGKYGVKE